MSIITELTHCRICKNRHLETVISLGEQAITSRFPTYGDFSTPKTPIQLCLCDDCGLLQLQQTTSSTELYEHEYGYRSGISNTMREHLRQYQQDVFTLADVQPNDTVLDIGSNDATTLRYYPDTVQRIGMDPTGEQFREYYNDTITLIPTYFTRDNFMDIKGSTKCKVVSSISMFYDLPDPIQFAKDIYDILEDDGIWTCEQSYLLTMLKTNSIDTICHEHLEYYSLRPVKEIADRAQFKIVDIQFNDCNGGSFRLYFAKESSLKFKENTELVQRILNEEIDYGILKESTYRSFFRGCEEEVQKLKLFLDATNKIHKKTYIYGASTKGNCLLQFADIKEIDIPFAVERNPKKIGKMTITGSRIIGEDAMREHPPDYLLVLPWHFRKEIVERESAFLEGGGSLVFPFPSFEIVSRRQKVLITGSGGHIAKYLIDAHKKHNHIDLYGICRANGGTIDTTEKIPTFVCDMVFQPNLWKQIIVLLQPDSIIHLAGISSSIDALHNVPNTYVTNGLLTVELCDFIYKQKQTSKKQIKLFNASSSEIYKGHINYIVTDDDTYYKHLHPYSIAKIVGHMCVDDYRQRYGCLFSNGVLFTTESKHKSTQFLFNKIGKYIRQYKQDSSEKDLSEKDSYKPLIVGSLDSYRSMLHASDVADAIYTIIEQPLGSNYVISPEKSEKISELVMKMFEISGITIVQETPKKWVDAKTGQPILIIDETNFDVAPTNICGYAEKLRNIGWTPEKTVDFILNEIIS